MPSNEVKTVTQGMWSVSVYITGAELHVHRYPHGGYWPSFAGDGNGKVFLNSEEAWKWALEHGYTEVYYRRTWCEEHRCLHTFLKKPSPTFGKCHRESDECD